MHSIRLKVPLAALAAAAVLACCLIVAESRADGSGGDVSAAAKALVRAGASAHGAPYDIESEVLRGKEVWEIKVATGRGRASEVHVSANGARVIDAHKLYGTDKEAVFVGRAKVRLAGLCGSPHGRRAGRSTRPSSIAGAVGWSGASPSPTAEARRARSKSTRRAVGSSASGTTIEGAVSPRVASLLVGATAAVLAAVALVLFAGGAADREQIRPVELTAGGAAAARSDAASPPIFAPRDDDLDDDAKDDPFDDYGEVGDDLRDDGGDGLDERDDRDGEDGSGERDGAGDGGDGG